MQPLLGDFVDRFHSSVLPKMMAALLLCSLGCFAFIQVFPSGRHTFRAVLCDWRVGGIGAGVGLLSYSFASLGIGYVIAWLGADWMIWIVLCSLILQIVLVTGYPQIDPDRAGNHDAEAGEPEQSVSILMFWRKYRFFFITISGVMLIAMCHAMTENYLINIFTRMGDDSSNVGTALFIACISAAPVLMFIERKQARTGFSILMRLSGLFYICKAMLMLQAQTVLGIYLIELLQFCTYGFTYPLLYYFTKERIMEADMVKGQAVAMVLYTMGLALGNYVGGRLIDLSGVNGMLFAALLSVAAGTVVINITIGKTNS